jgi:hypothetical protein
MLEMQSYLSSSRHPDTSRLVGMPLDVPLETARFLPQVRFVLPREAGGGTLTVDATPVDGKTVEPAADGTPSHAADHSAVLADTDVSGIYQAQLTGTDASQRVERFAFNVMSEEGDLHKLDAEQLASRLDGIRYEFHQAADIDYNPQQLAGFNLSESLLYCLIAILLGEQVLAYACSYHPAAKGGAR